jgi:hypothetical protein
MDVLNEKRSKRLLCTTLLKWYFGSTLLLSKSSANQPLRKVVPKDVWIKKLNTNSNIIGNH